MDTENYFDYSNETPDIAKQKNIHSILPTLKWFFTHPNLKYAVTRMVTGLITLLLIAGCVFLLLRMIPKDGYYSKAVLQKLNTPAEQQRYKDSIDKKYGFDLPKIVQLRDFYWDILPIPRTYVTKYGFTDDTFTETVPTEWVTRLIYLGESQQVSPNTTTLDLLIEKIPVSFQISIISTILTYVFAYPMGVAMARHKGKWQDKLGNGFIVLNFAIPALVFYLIIWRVAILLLAALQSPLTTIMPNVPWSEYRKAFSTYSADYPIASIVPGIFSITFLSIPGVAMWVRRFMVDEGDSDYVKFARSKGLSEKAIMYKHVLRNAIVPLVRNFPAAFIGAIIGSYFVEKVWGIPGTGRLLITAMNPVSPDNGLVQGLVIVYAALSMISYILGDIVTMIVDPRIKLTK